MAFLFAGLAMDIFGQLHITGEPFAASRNPAEKVVFVNPVKEVPGYPVQGADDKFPLYAGFVAGFPAGQEKSGAWILTDKRKSVWMLGITVNGAKALNIYFEKLNLTIAQQLFIYDPSITTVLGAFTSLNNDDNFATELIPGDSLVIEFDSPEYLSVLPFVISGVGVSVLDVNAGNRGFGDAGFCEVKVNCPEGNAWQNEKRGVARVLVREGSSLFWCTGSLINNTRLDGMPYFLTADHCGKNATEKDYSDWVFYFNFESKDCEMPLVEPQHQSLSGSILVAQSGQGTSTGSDFKLLLLNDEVPKNYHPYYNGWNRTGEISASGVGIHHPEGDLKMISTYESSTVSTRYNDPSADPQGGYWKVTWAKTQSGHGVTEGGSSGSPLFDPSGYIIGQLSGGRASCSSVSQPDYYGKFSKSWNTNGSDSSFRLQPWLDPTGSGVQTLRGIDLDSSFILADFTADFVEISVDGRVQFNNNSSGNFSSSRWYFPGGDPETSEMTDPMPVTYKNTGEYDVKLVIKSANKTDSLIRKNYIRVLPSLTPNPSTGNFKIVFGNKIPDDLVIKVNDMNGREINFFLSKVSESAVNLNLSTQAPGVYFVRMMAGGKAKVLKAMVAK